ncbi:hydantoinase/oxoprolinase family protein [Ruegeria arenilitoris]|uniref:hydantoinase/oxoprolinase family protein n=1 Tax=Ruegeria arenilitoris TaxID=1173585 RepID=UPI00147C21D5|nr:hydantoinase/oxoprolinase family protein [Ruegeria arenilitoris]
MSNDSGLRLAIDIGGTFTDTVLIQGPSQILATTKTPTTPDQPAVGAIEGARSVLKEAGRDWSQINGMIHGTTLATNALIERRGARVATVTTEGFRDILEIGYERRYSQYAINLVKPDLLVPRTRALTIGGRVDAHGKELTQLDEGAVLRLVADLQRLNCKAVAICLMHSYANPAQELRLRALLTENVPDLVVSLSHEVSPEAREFERLCTTVANAYIQPLMGKYLADFKARFAAEGLKCPILMMTAGGGMTTVETAARLPIRLVESGPAGGAILASQIAEEVDARKVLSFDMGGTTAKLCLIDDFRPQTARKFEISRAERFIKGSGMPVRIPAIEMIEIGAGGGSIASLDRLNRLCVGPQSAGSDPGPAGFGKGGINPTVTDADISQGYIDPDRFAEGRLQVDRAASDRSVSAHIGSRLSMETDDAAFAISEIVDENMASAGRMHAVESGKDLSARLMIAFGGNGPLHATRVARRSQVRRILIPRDPGVGSAVGFLFAPVSFEIVRSFYTTIDSLDLFKLNSFFADLYDEAEEVVRAGAPDATLRTRRVAFMRYHGQGHEIEVELPNRTLTFDDLENLRSDFESEYIGQFKRIVPGMTIEVLNWGLTVSAPVPAPLKHTNMIEGQPVDAWETRDILCDISGVWCKAGVFERSALKPDDIVSGPALIVEPQTTTFVSADFTAQIDTVGNIWLTGIQEIRT